MTDLDREEAAFRAAFALHAEDVEPVALGSPRRHWRAPLLIAVIVLAVVGSAVAIAGTRGHAPDVPPADGATLRDAQWIGIRDIEVKAPAGWAPLYEPTRPDCIQVATDDPADPARAKRGYVVIGGPNRGVTLQGCFRKEGADDPDAVFGELPFPLWRPYVKVALARPDLGADLGPSRDTTSEFRGWRLTRKTYGDVQVSVLSAPGDEGLGAAVLDTVRRVTENHLGCAVDSPVLDRPDLKGAPLPNPAAVSGVVLCDYVTSEGRREHGLAGSRALDGDAARSLVTAILDAPAGSGPDRRPQACRYGTERALVLLFRGLDGKVVTQAYAYFDGCAGNGIVTGGGTHRLTRGNCAPLFAEPPIGMFIFHNMGIVDACADDSPDDEVVPPDQLR